MGVWGYFLPPFHYNPTLKSLPPSTLTPPKALRPFFLVNVLLPWIGKYTFTLDAHLGLIGAESTAPA